MLTIIDDGTKIDLTTYLNEYLDRATFMILPQKIGIASIFDFSIDTLEGEFGMILGADDILERDFLFHMAEAWRRNPSVSLIHPRVITINENSEIEIDFLDRFKQVIAPTNFKIILKGRLLVYSLISGNWMYFTSSTFRVSTLKSLKFNPDLKIAMDWDLSLRMAIGGHKFGHSKDSIFYYRRHGNSFSMREDMSVLRIKEELRVIKNARQLAKDNKSFDIWFISFFHFYSQLNYLYRKFTNYRKRRNS
jgi:hypothetical protein